MTRKTVLALTALLAVGACSVQTSGTEVPYTSAPTQAAPTPVVTLTPLITPAPTLAPTPTAAPTPSPVPTVAPTPIVFVGAGMENTKPFVTTSGHFSVAYTLGCDGYFAATIYSTASEYVDMIGNVGGNKVSGTSEEYIKAGSYYFSVSAGCPWTLTVTEAS